MLVGMKEFVVWCVIVLCLATVGGLPAQVRQPLVGTVTRANGQPLPGATVTLVENDADLVGLDPVDVVHVTTDQRGRFVASALRGVRYSAFAVGPEVDGTALVAQPVLDLACGRQAKLVAAVTGVSRPVLLERCKEWGERNELRVRLRWPNCPGYSVDLPFDQEWRVHVPASSVVGSLDLYSASGRRLGGIWVSPAGKAEVMVPTFAKLDVRVVDEDGKPIEGAEVHLQRQGRGSDFATVVTHDYFRGDSAVTDAKGLATLRCQPHEHPIDQTSGTSSVVVASKPGFFEGASGRVSHEPFIAWAVKAHQGRRILIPLKAIKPIAPAKKNVVSTEFAGKRAQLFAMTHVHKTDGGMVMNYFLHRSYEVALDTKGGFSMPPISPTATDLILSLPPVEGRRVMMLPTMSPELPEADVSKCDVFSLQLLDVSGGPASNASVLLLPRDPSTLSFWHVAPLVPDQAGRLDVLLQRGEWTLLAMDETTWVSSDLADWSDSKLMKLQLDPMFSRRVRVLDAKDQPVAGAKFGAGSFRYGLPTAPGLPAVLAGLGWNTFATHIRRATTNADGEATLHFLPWLNVQPTAFAYLGSHRNRSEDTAIREGQELLIIHLK
ncbi:MAG: hypothetical protein ACJAYX_003014 [Planctomycetota bacterium]|jgi:hypothetical protein